jgi:hypothetical protein
MGARLDELGMVQCLREALQYERAYGGAAIFPGANDGSADLTKPLNLDRLKTFDWLTVLTPRELTPVRWYSDRRVLGTASPRFSKSVARHRRAFRPPRQHSDSRIAADSLSRN